MSYLASFLRSPLGHMCFEVAGGPVMRYRFLQTATLSPILGQYREISKTDGRSGFRRLTTSAPDLNGESNKSKLDVVEEDINLENLGTNPYFDKYKAKLEEAKKSGKKMKKTVPAGIKEKNQDDYMHKKQPLKKQDRMGSQTPSTATQLSSLMKMEMVESLEASNIETLWKDFHSDKDCVSAVIPLDTFDKLRQRAKKCPIFVLPLPKNDGVEMYLLQFSGPICAFTPLLEYQTHGENARAVLTLIHYTELTHKGIVLMRGEIDTDRIDIMDAQFFVNQLQIYYIQSDDAFDLVDTFNHRPADFDYNALIDRLDKLVP